MIIPFNPDIHQCIKWQQNKAPGLLAVIDSKATWYAIYNTQFWDLWKANVFDLRTASPFGLMIWCIILGVPSASFGLYPALNSFAFGSARQNFIYNGLDGTLPNPNLVGGNFYGGGQGEILDFNEVRRLLQLRYISLVSNGSLKFINRMLRYIWNGDAPWDFPGGNYFYAADSTIISNPLVLDSLYRTDWQGRQALYPTPRTNLLAFSEQMDNAAWVKAGATITANATTAPDGTVTADKLVESVGGSAHYQDQIVNGTYTTGQVFCGSYFIKAAERTTARLSAYYAIGGAVGVTIYFNLAAKTVYSQSAAVLSSGVQDIGNGWLRCWFTAAVDTPAETKLLIRVLPCTPPNVSSYAGDGTSGFYVWGAQLAKVVIPGSYIKTPGGSAVTLTDYSYSPTTGIITFGAAPLAGSLIDWSGTWGGVPAVGSQAFGNGLLTAMQIPKPPGFVSPIASAFQVEFRIGKHTGISSQAVNVLNDPAMGILPTTAGSKSTAIQES